MIQEFCLAWEKNKGKLEKYFRTTSQRKYGEYKDLVKLLFDIVINPEEELKSYRFDTDNILVIDDGDYQGTQVFILHRDSYQPGVEEYVYTNTYYGSCSGCDTLLYIQDYGRSRDIPDESQVDEYLTLCLHLLQKCNFMIDSEEN